MRVWSVRRGECTCVVCMCVLGVTDDLHCYLGVDRLGLGITSVVRRHAMADNSRKGGGGARDARVSLNQTHMCISDIYLSTLASPIIIPCSYILYYHTIRYRYRIGSLKHDTVIIYKVYPYY